MKKQNHKFIISLAKKAGVKTVAEFAQFLKRHHTLPLLNGRV